MKGYDINSIGFLLQEIKDILSKIEDANMNHPFFIIFRAVYKVMKDYLPSFVTLFAIGITAWFSRDHIIASMREKWINELRNLISELLTEVNHIAIAHPRKIYRLADAKRRLKRK